MTAPIELSQGNERGWSVSDEIRKAMGLPPAEEPRPRTPHTCFEGERPDWLEPEQSETEAKRAAQMRAAMGLPAKEGDR